LEEEDDKTSVTFVHLACSGAEILEGLIGPYQGFADEVGNPPLGIPSQVSQLVDRVGSREIDAIVFSIGINDVRFGPITTVGSIYANCPTLGFDEEHGVTFFGATVFSAPVVEPTFPSVQQFLDTRFELLDDWYSALADRLRNALPGFAFDRLYQLDYPDPTRADATGAFCDPMIDTRTELNEILGDIKASFFFDKMSEFGATVRIAAALRADLFEANSQPRQPQGDRGVGLDTAANAGETSLEVTDTSGFAPGDRIRINPGGPNEEENMVVGFGSLLLATPLHFDHEAGECIITLLDPVDIPPICQNHIFTTSQEASVSGTVC
jgi:hypothetical protein